MNRFVLKNTFVKTYIYCFLINIFIKIRSQSYVLETISLSEMTSFTNLEGVYDNKDLSRKEIQHFSDDENVSIKVYKHIIIQPLQKCSTNTKVGSRKYKRTLEGGWRIHYGWDWILPETRKIYLRIGGAHGLKYNKTYF
jgi:hypothetical protein